MCTSQGETRSGHSALSPDRSSARRLVTVALAGAHQFGPTRVRAMRVSCPNVHLPTSRSVADVHAFEVKGYWDIGRDALYEAAAGRHATLLAFVAVGLRPGRGRVAWGPATPSRFGGSSRCCQGCARRRTGWDVGFAIASSTAPAAGIRIEGDEGDWWTGVRPRRQVMDPSHLDTLLGWLAVSMEHPSASGKLTTTD